MAIALSERAPSVSAAPLPEKIASLVHEARWLVAAVAAAYLALILWGFDKADPGWSHAALVDHIANPGGRAGAWLADLWLYIFGVSAWWWVALLAFLVAWGYRRLNSLFGGDRRPLAIAMFGFSLVLVASCRHRGDALLEQRGRAALCAGRCARLRDSAAWPPITSGLPAAP